jgi:hypothetical protein
MPPLGFELTIPASARPQTYALDHAATGIADEAIRDTNPIPEIDKDAFFLNQ